MDNSIATQAKQYGLISLHRNVPFYLPTAATALIFFLPYYFVHAMQLSLLQAGFLLSFYGVGSLIAIGLIPYLSLRHSPRKIILFSLCVNCIILADLLYVNTFLAFSVNLALLGFAEYLYKNTQPHLILQQYNESLHAQTRVLQHSYKASNLSLVLAMLLMALFAFQDFKTVCISALILNALPLFFLMRNSDDQPKSIVMDNLPHSNIFASLLVFLGGLLLSQLTATLNIYLSLNFPQIGLRAMALFMIVNISLVAGLQTSLLGMFKHGNAILRGGFGALLIGLSLYILNLAHLFSLVMLSAMMLSLGEIFLIGNLYSLCRKHFQSILAISLIIGSSLGAYLYQFFDADILWQSCGYIGVGCFALVAVREIVMRYVI